MDYIYTRSKFNGGGGGGGVSNHSLILNISYSLLVNGIPWCHKTIKWKCIPYINSHASFALSRNREFIDNSREDWMDDHPCWRLSG